MAKGEEPPEFQNADNPNLVAGGNQSLNFALDLMKNGLPPELKEAMTEQFQNNLGGQIRSGEQSLQENFASQGNAPSGALLGGLVSQQSNANNASRNYYADLLSQDFNARQTGFQNATDIQRLLAGVSGQMNQYNLGRYQIDQENDFNWGDFLGDALGFGSKFIKPRL